MCATRGGSGSGAGERVFGVLPRGMGRGAMRRRGFRATVVGADDKDEDDSSSSSSSSSSDDDEDDDEDDDDDDDEKEDDDDDDGSVTATSGEDEYVERQEDLFADVLAAAKAELRSVEEEEEIVKWYGGVEPAKFEGSRKKLGSEPFHLHTPHGDDVATFTAEDVGKFWSLPESVVAEAETPAALRKEFDVTKTRRVLFRACDLEIKNAIESGVSVLLDGQAGSGKSVSLANVVSWARATGYLVLYVPSGKAMCTYSNYSKDEASGLWNTPDHAALLIKWLQEGSASALEELGMTQTARDGLEALEAEPTQTVDAALAIVEAFKSAARDQGKKVLFAVDEYNALFGPSDMHEVLGPRKRGNIPAGSTRINAALRDATAIVSAGASYVAATSGTISLSPALRRVLFYLTLVPVRPRSRGERRSLRTFLPGVSLRPHLAGFNPDTPPSTPFNSASDAFELHPDIIARMERP